MVNKLAGILKKRKSSSDFEILVVSKDRPLSLLSFLQSIERNFQNVPKIKVAISCSRAATYRRYQNIKFNSKLRENLFFIYESDSFRNAFTECLKKIKTDSVMLCVDDQVFYQKVSYQDIVNEKRKVDFFTLRLGTTTTYSFNLDRNIQLPIDRKINHRGIKWKCKMLRDDLHYCISFDTTVMDKAILVMMTKFLKFRSPNQLESYMNYSFPTATLLGYTIGCFQFQAAVNFVLNRVQKDNKNRSLDYSLSELNKLFDTGMVIDVDPAAITQFNSSHANYGFIFRLAR